LDKLVFILTHGEEDAEKATLPVVMAVTALASDIQATVVLQSSAVWLAKKGFARIIHENPFPPLVDLMGQFLDAGGRLLVCQPCLRKRNIEPGELIEGAVIVNAPTIIKEVAEATNVLTY
jgi:predicted peroxiredoxin